MAWAAIRFLVFGSAERGARGRSSRDFVQILRVLRYYLGRGRSAHQSCPAKPEFLPRCRRFGSGIYPIFSRRTHPPKQKQYCSRDSLLKANGNLPNILPRAACSEPRCSYIPPDIPSPRSWRVWLTMADKETQTSQRIPTQASYRRV